MLAGFEAPDVRAHLHRRAGHGGRAALQTPRQHDVPVLRAVPAHDGGAERCVRPEAGRRVEVRDRRARAVHALAW